MKTLLHIGAPKTATTFLQDSYYPYHPEIAYIPHVSEWNRWVFSLNKADCRALAICEEGIIGRPHWRRKILENINEFIKDPLILITTRAATSGLLDSIYSQAVRGGDLRSFNHFFQDEIGVWREVYNFDLIYRESCSIFGPERVLLLPYELLRDDQNQFLRLLENALGISTFSPAKGGPVNPKMTESQILFYRKFAPIISRIASLRGNVELPLYAKKIYLTHSSKMQLISDKVGSLLQLLMKKEPKDADRFLAEFSCYSPVMKTLPSYEGHLDIYKRQ